MKEVAALSKAAGTGCNLELLKHILREHPAAATASSGQRPTPLHRAAQFGKPDAIVVLVQAGADVCATASRNLRTPLHAAAAKGWPDAVTRLLAHGAKADAADENGLTPLHLACLDCGAHACLDCGAHAALDVVRTLVLDGGADVTTTFKVAGKVLFDLRERLEVDVGEFSSDGQVQAIHVAAIAGAAGVVGALVKAGADPNAAIQSNCFDRTPATYAASHDRVPVLQVLHACGVDLVSKNSAGMKRRSPLHAAAECGHETALRYLIDLGAVVDADDDLTSPRTALDYACRGHRVGAVVELLKAGCTITSRAMMTYMCQMSSMCSCRRCRPDSKDVEAPDLVPNGRFPKNPSGASVIAVLLAADVKWRATASDHQATKLKLPSIQRFWWSPRSHPWVSSACKDAVTTVLLLAERFNPRSQRQQQAITRHPLFLPNEMWHLLLSMVERHSWMV